MHTYFESRTMRANAKGYEDGAGFPAIDTHAPRWHHREKQLLRSIIYLMRSQLTGKDQKEVRQALVTLERVTLLRGVLENRVSKAVLTLLATLVPPEQENDNVAR